MPVAHSFCPAFSQPPASCVCVYLDLSPPMFVELDPSSKSASFMSLGKSFNLSKPQFSRLCNGDTSQNVVRNEWADALKRSFHSAAIDCDQSLCSALGFSKRRGSPKLCLWGGGPETTRDLDESTWWILFALGLMLFSIIKNAATIKPPTRMNNG